MDLSVEKKIVVGFGVALAVLLAVWYMQFQTMLRLVNDSRSVNHSDEVLEQISALDSALRKAESAVRGFLIAPDQQFLEIHQSAVEAGRSHLDRLKALTADNARQKARCATLTDHIEQREKALLQLRAAGENKTTSPEVLRTFVEQGESYMELAERDLVAMKVEERSVLRERLEAARSAAHYTATAISVGVLAAATLLAIAGFIIFRDLQKQRDAERQIREARDNLEDRVTERTAELQSAYKELETFAYSVSHDLRTPMRHIDGYASMIREKFEGELNDEIRRYLSKITAASQHMGQLVDGLLVFSRLGRAGLYRSHIDLNQVIHEVRQSLEPEIAGRNVVWKIADLPEIYADRTMIGQVFLNLLSNALKYTRNCTEAVIEVGCSAKTSADAVIQVRDNGVGFDMKYAQNLFKVFSRLHGSEFEGTGVGLASARRIVERHGGKIWAEASPGAGATFYVSLPRKLEMLS
jgi:signal transduction histidine kinase